VQRVCSTIPVKPAGNYVRNVANTLDRITHHFYEYLLYGVVVAFITISTTSGCTSSAVNTQSVNQRPDLSSAPFQIRSQYKPAEKILTGFLSITDIHVSSSGFLYVTDSDLHFVYRFNLNESDLILTADSVGGRGSRNTQFDRPSFIDASNDLKIYVSDTGNNRIQQFDRRFQPLGTVSVGSGSVNYSPGALVTNSFGELIFWDQGSMRLRKINASMQEDRLFNPAVSMLRSSPVSIINSLEGFMLAESESGNLYRYSTTGRYIGFWSFAAGIRDICWHNGFYYLLYADKIVKVEPNGSTRYLLQIEASQLGRISGFNNYLIVSDSTGLFKIGTDLFSKAH